MMLVPRMRSEASVESPPAFYERFYDSSHDVEDPVRAELLTNIRLVGRRKKPAAPDSGKITLHKRSQSTRPMLTSLRRRNNELTSQVGTSAPCSAALETPCAKPGPSQSKINMKSAGHRFTTSPTFCSACGPRAGLTLEHIVSPVT